MYGGVKITPFVCAGEGAKRLTAKAVQGASLALESVHNVEGCDSLPAGVLGVCDSVPDHILQEHLEHAPGLLIDEARDTLDTSTASQTPDGRLGDACRAGTQVSDLFTIVPEQGLSAGGLSPLPQGNMSLQLEVIAQHKTEEQSTIGCDRPSTAGETLEAVDTGQPAGNGRELLTLDVVAKDLPVALGTSLSESLSSLTAARHGCKSLRAVGKCTLLNFLHTDMLCAV